MLTTFDRKDWQEDPVAERERQALNARSSPDEFRRLYPYKVRIIKSCKAYNLKVGEIMMFARPKQTPQHFPLEAVKVDLTNNSFTDVRHMFFSTEEAELMEI